MAVTTDPTKVKDQRPCQRSQVIEVDARHHIAVHHPRFVGPESNEGAANRPGPTQRRHDRFWTQMCVLTSR